MSDTIGKDKVVTIGYTLRDDQGTILERTMDGDEFSYLHGHSQIIPGLETVLEGREEGDVISADIPPEQAYGSRNEELIIAVPKNQFPEGEPIEPGVQVQARTADGTQIFTVTDVAGDDVILDGNHPLADRTLHFDVRVEGVRDATDEEKAHGHSHQGGHHHGEE